jgi:hypothetical protein
MGKHQGVFSYTPFFLEPYLTKTNTHSRLKTRVR